MGWMLSSRDHENNLVTYAYDALGQQTHVTDPDGNVTATAYDIRGNKVAMSDPDRGSWTLRANALGLLAEQTDAKGQKTTITYDVLGRMLTRVDDALGPNPGDRTSTWVHDTRPKGVGKLASSAGYGYGAVPSYDAFGRPSSLAETMGTSTYTVTAGYDAQGRPRTTTYPSGLTVESVYAASGHLEQVRHATSGHIYWRALSTDARGNVTASRLGNGVEELRAHEDATGFLTSIKSYAPNAGGAIQDLAYTFDRLGNLRRRQDTRANLDETFAYDTLNRVVSVATTVPGTLPGSPAAPPSGGGSAASVTTTVSVTYNRLGNITSRSDLGAYAYGLGSGQNPDPSCGAASHAGPHAVVGVAGPGKTAAYCYDLNGDMVSGDERTVTWSAFGMPTRLARGLRSIDLTYGPSRSRFRRVDTNETGQTTTHYVAGGALEVTTTQAGTITRKTTIAGAAVVIETEALPGQVQSGVRFQVSGVRQSSAVLTPDT